jgi:hypothetical protein
MIYIFKQMGISSMHLKISSSVSSTMAKCTLYCYMIEELVCDSNFELQFVSDDSHIEDKILITTFQQISEDWAKIHQFSNRPTPPIHSIDRGETEVSGLPWERFVT